MFFLSIRKKLLRKQLDELRKNGKHSFTHLSYVNGFVEDAKRHHAEYKGHLQTWGGFFKSFIPDTDENKARKRCAESLANARNAIQSVSRR